MILPPSLIQVNWDTALANSEVTLGGPQAGASNGVGI